jgi:ABC-type antimicrobial peptide transport system permease subunit
MWLMTTFGGSALLLALVGVYSVAACSVQQRTQEIGIRLSLGATPNSIRNMVIVQGLRLAIFGIAIGNVSAFIMTRLLVGFLYGVTATDPATFLSASLLLIVAILASMFIPARLATRLSPSIALRFE